MAGGEEIHTQGRDGMLGDGLYQFECGAQTQFIPELTAIAMFQWPAQHQAILLDAGFYRVHFRDKNVIALPFGQRLQGVVAVGQQIPHRTQMPQRKQVGHSKPESRFVNGVGGGGQHGSPTVFGNAGAGFRQGAQHRFCNDVAARQIVKQQM